MKKIGFAIIGAGAIAKSHADAIIACPGAHLESIVSDNTEQASRLAGTYKTSYDNTLEQALSRSAVDAVCICTPSFLHADMAVTALHAGRHVLVEKPMDISVVKADAMVAAAERSGKTLGVVFQNRTSDAIRGVKAAITAGRLGRIVACSARVNWFRSEKYYAASDWRGTWEKDGGGAAMNQGIHYIDMLIHLVGDIDSVTAESDTLHHAVETEDTIAAVIRFANGAIGTFQAATAAFPGLPPVIEVSGTKGSVIIQNGAVRFRYYADEHGADVGDYGLEGNASAPYFTNDATATAYSGGHAFVINDFVTAIHTGREPFVSGVEGRKSLAAVDAMYRSAREGSNIIHFNSPLQTRRMRVERRRVNAIARKASASGAGCTARATSHIAITQCNTDENIQSTITVA
ncbi:MAG: Gfo/Idh/MocA family oxidoreductase [Spirochaetes bacterium]|nr:Gfo/Idh/MocA family oxidoreductase [Spirochaetota bacterium]